MTFYNETYEQHREGEMASKLSRYIMSERFQGVIGHGVEKAVARTRAAGLTPAGDPNIKPSIRPVTTVIVEAPTPAIPRSNKPRDA